MIIMPGNDLLFYETAIWHMQSSVVLVNYNYMYN